jgi:hypothetical protein
MESQQQQKIMHGAPLFSKCRAPIVKNNQNYKLRKESEEKLMTKFSRGLEGI